MLEIEDAHAFSCAGEDISYIEISAADYSLQEGGTELLVSGFFLEHPGMRTRNQFRVNISE